MRGPSLQNAAAVSLMLHLAILLFSIIVMHASRTVVLPSPYTVSLVSLSRGRSSEESVSKAAESKSAAVEKAVTPEEKRNVTQTDHRSEEEDVNKKIAAIKKKAEAIDNLARKSDIRKRIAEISGKAGSAKSAAKSSEKHGAAGGQKGTPTDMYIAKISDAIWREWRWPDTADKNLEAIILVKINRDGSITVQEKEKASGNLFFDRSVLQAIAKASPVTPPPGEMEIGIRFRP